MMKVSDPNHFGAVEAYFASSIRKYATLFQELNIDTRNGLVMCTQNSGQPNANRS
jgi:isocitrate dehydrogenase